MFMVKEFSELFRSIYLNISYLSSKGKGLRWPLVQHGGRSFHHSIEVIENEVLASVQATPLVKFLTMRGKQYILVAEVTESHLWVNVYSPIQTESPGPFERPLYDEWKGKNAIFTFILKEGKVVRPPRIRNIYWADQTPLMSVKTTLSRNAITFFDNITEEV